MIFLKLNFILIDYFGPPSCPGSPTLPDKLSLSTPNATTLSPPGNPLTASATSLASSGKRRGLGLTGGHRASYKRAHTGRLVSNTKKKGKISMLTKKIDPGFFSKDI
jgi:hypothetical protein